MTEKKKGRASWQPAKKLDVYNKDPNYVYRWCDKDSANIEKKLAEGWVLVDKTSKIGAEHVNPGDPLDGKPLTSAKTYRELVLMALPKEMKEARDEYYQEQTRKQTIGLKRDLERQNREAAGPRSPAPIHGTIVIS